MVRIAIVVILITVGAGCRASSKSTGHRGPGPGDCTPRSNDPAVYLTGFMEGYAAARPDQQIRSNDSLASWVERRTSYGETEVYRHGWRDGYHTGVNDVKQAEQHAG